MGVQQRITNVSIAKQTAKGAAASAGTYNFGVTGGQVVKADVSEEDLTQAFSGRIRDGFDRVSVVPSMALEGIAFPKMIGLLLLGAMGTDTVTGTTPKTHTFSVADDLPYLTLFAQYGAASLSNYYKVSDARVSSLEFTWDRASALRYKAEVVGCSLSGWGTSFTVGTVEKPVSDGTFKGVNASGAGTFQMDGATAVVKSGSIKITNALEPVIGSASVEPVDVFNGLHDLEVSLTVIPDDLLMFRKMVTGAAGGTTTAVVPYFSAASTIKHVLDATTDLTWTLSKMRLMTEFPQSDPQGGPAEVTVVGQISVPAAGTPYDVALRNSVASY